MTREGVGVRGRGRLLLRFIVTDTGRKYGLIRAKQPLGTGVPGCPRPARVAEKEEFSASVGCDKIAKEMWAGYQQCLKERGFILGT